MKEFKVGDKVIITTTEYDYKTYKQSGLIGKIIKIYPDGFYTYVIQYDKKQKCEDGVFMIQNYYKRKDFKLANSYILKQYLGIK
jgi:hypothetical protein